MNRVAAHGHTLASTAVLSGVGLFTGAPSSVAVAPAPAGSGLVFRRADHPDRLIPALVRHVVPENRHTALSTSGPAAGVHTVEHLLSALVGLGIWDARIDVRGPEVPLADGSALPFVRALLDAGVCAHDAPTREPIRLNRPIRVEDGPASIEARPHDSPARRTLALEYHLDYGPNAPLPPQRFAFELDPAAGSAAYADEVAPARTFALAEEAQAMRRSGLFSHLSPRDVLVLGPDGPIDNALRFPDEPARHKLLDLLGDLALIGRPLVGRIIARRSGHALNHAIARAVIESHP
ncbi:MAG: UDP-3-O-[3-hydroxymyristoyl] N-acetylglucosamine deacetylase [Phycisphaerae bacterium]|nr:UDP-3-O-[3-hydroxymyristoyl] N-acetylglucosamine deacetylase [Phycisphaerae bacterium]